jgi:DNA-binding XRE family transcriptional regulator
MVTRIRQLLDTKQLTPTQFADFIGVGRPVMSHILSERNKPSLEVVQRIISAFPEISLPWLLSGVGEMLGEVTSAAAVTPPAAEEQAVMAPATIAPVEEESVIASGPVELEIAQPQAISPAEEPIEAVPVTPIAPPTPQAVPAASPTPASAAPATPQAFSAAPRAFPTGRQAFPTGPTPVAAPASGSPLASVVTQPFRAARFVPAAAPAAAPRRSAEADLPASEASAMASTLPLPAADRPATSLSTMPTKSKQSPEAALLPFLGEPGKEIRRIVIFYRDGSFANYQPEA